MKNKKSFQLSCAQISIIFYLITFFFINKIDKPNIYLSLINIWAPAVDSITNIVMQLNFFRFHTTNKQYLIRYKIYTRDHFIIRKKKENIKRGCVKRRNYDVLSNFLIFPIDFYTRTRPNNNNKKKERRDCKWRVSREYSPFFFIEYDLLKNHTDLYICCLLKMMTFSVFT